MYESVVYYGGEKLGEVMVYPSQSEEAKRKPFDLKEIRITEFSKPSERCPPLAVLHTITTSSSSSSSSSSMMMNMMMSFKMESKSKTSSWDNNSPLYLLHSSCIRENKTAVMPLGGDELHLVAMHSRRNGGQYPCFWAFIVTSGLYSSCLVMLNLRCLGIVFDLDETLVVANTMRSFEDRIEVLQRKINTEVDPQRVASMLAEVKRYQEDKTILKQYAENDQVVDNGVVFKTQDEAVPALSDNHQPIVRPLLRLHEKNIILTRINPQIRDTSVLVRLRPAWEDLRRYLTAKGRKRFEVYVCTMAERDYALEMWRLLDPEANLISTEELLERIVCVKSGLKKSLFNVFQAKMCHPKMALVVDDRLKVWDEKDQPRVHVVPAYAPYYAPQAEANISPPVLCVARNVACNVRGSFFKEFDEGLLQRIPEIAYEDAIKDIPFPPDVSDYLLPEDDAAAATNGSKDPSNFDGMADVEVERRLKEAAAPVTGPSLAINFDPRLAAPITVAESSSSFPLAAPQTSTLPFLSVQYPQTVAQLRPSNHIRAPEVSSPAREEGEVGESELDPDTRRRLLILKHGQDIREPPLSEPSLPRKPPLQVSVPLAQSHGSWVPGEEEMSPRLLNRTGVNNLPLDSQPMQTDKIRSDYPPFYRKLESSTPPDRIAHDNQRLHKEVLYRDERPRSNHSFSYYQAQPSSGEGLPLSRPVPSSREPDSEFRRADLCSETSAGVLQGIATKCGSKVEFRPALVASTELQFCVEAWFAGRKIGEGIGRTRREAQYHASESSLKHLANIYMSHVKPDTVPADNGVLTTLNSSGKQYPPRGESAPFSISSETSKPMDPRIEGLWRSKGPVSALKELCTMEGLDVVFQPSPITYLAEKDEVHAQVEVDGKVLGKGTGLTWDEAMTQAADRALGSLRCRFPQKRQASPRSMQEMSSKRFRPEFQQYPRNATSVPSEFKHPY